MVNRRTANNSQKSVYPNFSAGQVFRTSGVSQRLTHFIEGVEKQQLFPQEKHKNSKI